MGGRVLPVGKTISPSIRSPNGFLLLSGDPACVASSCADICRALGGPRFEDGEFSSCPRRLPALKRRAGQADFGPASSERPLQVRMRDERRGGLGTSRQGQRDGTREPSSPPDSRLYRRSLRPRLPALIRKLNTRCGGRPRWRKIRSRSSRQGSGMLPRWRPAKPGGSSPRHGARE